MKVTIQYTDYCLPDYFVGSTSPWVQISGTEEGYTSRELRKAILSEFAQGAIGGSDPIMGDYIHSVEDQKRADKFFSKALPACVNREIKFRGKRLKLEKDQLDCEEVPYLFVVFKIED